MSTSDSLQREEARIRDAYAKRRRGHLYSRFNPAHLLVLQERERCLVDLLSREEFASLDNKKVLEIGCGDGELLRDFIKWGARPENIYAVELLPDRVAEAKQLCPSAIRIFESNGANLQFLDATFDLVLQSTVFTSVLDTKMKRQMASEMYRVLKPDGAILWYDFYLNNPKNLDVRGVKFREIEDLFPNCSIRLRRVTLAPPIARRLAPYSWLLCHILSKVPWLCSHYLGIIRKEPGPVA